MVTISGLLVSCAGLLNIAYCATIKDINPIKQQDEWVCTKIPEDRSLRLGRSYKFNGIPYFYYELPTSDTSLSEMPRFVELFSTSGDRCELPWNSTNGYLWTPYENGVVPRFEIYEVSTEMLWLVRNFYSSNGITAINMSTCKITDIGKKINSKFTSEYWDFTASLLHYEDGFDAIIENDEKKNRISYDTMGNQISEPRPFMFEFLPGIISPMSPKSRNSNLVVQYFNQTIKAHEDQRISILDADGHLIKHLVIFNEPEYVLTFDDINYSLYAYCFGDNDVQCVQFDELGNEKYRNSTKITGEVLAVTNLKETGVVLFTATDKEIRAIVMRPGKIDEKSYPVTRVERDLIFLTDFDEDTYRFTMHILSSEKNCQHTFSLQSEQP